MRRLSPSNKIRDPPDRQLSAFAKWRPESLGTLLIPQFHDVNTSMKTCTTHACTGKRDKKAIRYKLAQQKILASSYRLRRNFGSDIFGSKKVVHRLKVKMARGLDCSKTSSLSMHTLPLQYRHPIFRTLTHWHSSGFSGYPENHAFQPEM